MTDQLQYQNRDSSLTHPDRSFETVTVDDIEMQIQRREVGQGCQDQGHGHHLNNDEWTSDIEELIKHWKDQTEKLSHIHQESGYINRTRYYRLAIPSIALPFGMTFFSQLFYNGNALEPVNIINGIAFMTTSILSALSLFFNYNQLSECHFQTSARYTDISNRIDSELARRRKFRTPSDVFITELKCRIESLGDGAPQLPGTWC